MAKISRRTKMVKSTRRAKIIRHGLKWIADNQKPHVLKEYLKTAPRGVIKGVVNAALNIQKGQGIKLTPAQRRFFGRHKKHFAFLTSKSVGFEKKRRAIQTGGFPAALLVPIITTAVSLLGKLFMPKND